MKPIAVMILALSSACTTLGPMPASTTVAAVPVNRPGVEVQAGGVPGFMLSDATHKPRGAVLGQISALVEPDAWLGVKGLIVGARQAGDEGNTIAEPFVGIRRMLDDSTAIAAIGFGTHAEGEASEASYEATRVGGEVAVDTKVFANSWIGLHAQASVSATALSATGRYCVGSEGKGTDCDGDGEDQFVDADLFGVYAAATTGLSLDLFRRADGFVHAIRLAAMVTAGAMPRVRMGVQEKGDPYVAGGLTLTVGVGQ